MADEPDNQVIYGIHQDALHDLEKLREGIQAMMEKEKDPPAVETGVEISNELHNRVLTFAALAAAALENKTATIVVHEVVDDDIRNREIRDFFRNGSQFSQHQREQLLSRADVIDGSLENQMQELRGQRNDLVHEVHGRFEFLNDYDEVKKYMDDTIDTLEELDRLIEGLGDN